MFNNNVNNFKWEYYVNKYEDLKKLNFKKDAAIEHWVKYGKNEGRTFLKKNEKIISDSLEKIKNDETINDDLKNKILENKFLFHKYHLDLEYHNKDITYEVISEINFDKEKFLCHIHCHNINHFKYIYENYIQNLQEFFNIVITYSLGNITKLEKYFNNYKVVILKIENKGLDIGSKFCFTKYIKNKKINYEYTLFLHSKKDPKRRLDYFNPFIKDKDTIINVLNIIKKEKNIGGIFPRLTTTDFWPYMRLYVNEYLNYKKINKNYNNNIIFIEGNVFILHKNISEFIYDDLLIYNSFNYINSFDYNWVRAINKLEKCNLDHSYYLFKKNNNIGNWMTKKLIKPDTASIKDHDFMIEHIFERIYNYVINHKKMKRIILK